jgi:RNA polymerase sigma-70 factor (ECF subfamily)
MANDQLAEWLSAARDGSCDALGQVLQACQGYLMIIARQEVDAALQPKGGPSDLVQETFLEAQRDFGRFHGTTEAELKAWLRQLLLHNVANFARRYRDTAKRQVDREVGLPTSEDSEARQLRLVADALSPSGQAIANEQTEAVSRSLDRLPADSRQVLLLRYQEDKTFDEIGVLMQRTASAARTLWLQALEQLQREMENPG